jgi:hypothetical protein
MEKFPKHIKHLDKIASNGMFVANNKLRKKTKEALTDDFNISCPPGLSNGI